MGPVLINNRKLRINLKYDYDYGITYKSLCFLLPWIVSGLSIQKSLLQSKVAVALVTVGGVGGCFIATAAYGSSMEPHVKVFRNFRDDFLVTTYVGRAFLDFYYTYPPPMANFIAKHDTVRLAMRCSLMPLIGLSWIALKIGLAVTMSLMILLLALMSTAVVIGIRWMQLRWQA